MLWNQAIGLATRQEQSHGISDPTHQPVAPAHDRQTALSVAYGAGLRASEVVAFKVGDIDYA